MEVERLPKHIELRNALLCGLAVVAALMLTNPFCESPFNDDWSYAQTVKILLQTGKLTYNGWAAASVIAQAYWGLLWVSVFGFSYTVLRFSTMPLAAGAISLCYLLGRRVGLRVRFAVFGALLVGLSPMYLPVADSFMTDAPGMFFMFLSIYLLARSIESANTTTAILWLCIGLIVGLIGGTSRQIVWVVPLVIGPYAAWVRRDNLKFVFAAVLGSAIVLGGAILSMRWFAHQPYSIPELGIKDQLKNVNQKKAHFVLNVLALLFTLIWMLLPALWSYVKIWTGPRVVLSFLLLIGPVMFLVKERPSYAMAPWMRNTITTQGVMGGAELSGRPPHDRPISIPSPVRILFAVAVLAMSCVVITDLLIWLARPLRAYHKASRFFLHPDQSQALLPAIILFSAAYFMLLLPRSASDQTYDRYILPLMPCILFPLLLKYQKQGERKIPRVSWALFSLYTVAAIMFTQDVIALDRARAEAAHRLMSAGIPRTRIDAGFEFNFETQILTQGYINDHRLKNPPGAYDPSKKYTPSVVAEYRIEYGPQVDTSPTPFGSVSYISFLYPFHRRICIDRFNNPTWLHPKAIGNTPTMPQPTSPDDSDIR